MAGADALSRETTFAGLPKAVKLMNTASQAAPATGVITGLVFNTLSFNYGGYTFAVAGGLYTGIVIPEPGIYDVRGQCAAPANTQLFAVELLTNGNLVQADGTSNEVYAGVAANNGGFFPTQQINMPVELKAGDTVALAMTQTTAVGPPTATTAGRVWLYVEKRGGQY